MPNTPETTTTETQCPACGSGIEREDTHPLPVYYHDVLAGQLRHITGNQLLLIGDIVVLRVVGN